jgi:hypothetical protein
MSVAAKGVSREGTFAPKLQNHPTDLAFIADAQILA